MVREDDQFGAWLAARWPSVVRLLVLLGHPQPTAERIAVEGLSRVYPVWERLWREDDVDVELYREVLEERERHVRRHPESLVEELPAPQPAPGLTEQADRWAEVQAALAAMSPDDREVLLLRDIAELSDEQIADVRGDHPRGDPGGPVAEELRFVAAAVQVSPVHQQDIGQAVRERRRRWWRRGVLAASAVVVVLAGATWITGGVGDAEGVEPANNPLPIPWYADGTLHLSEVTVKLPDVQQVLQVPGGVVVVDSKGEVSVVRADGERDRIGRTVPGTRVVVEADNGWVAWADPGNGDPELVVHDTVAEAEVGRRTLSVPGAGGGQPVGDSRPVAIDEERVYYRTAATDFAWEPLLGDSAFAVAGSLVDTADGARVSRHVDGLLVQPAPFRTGFVVRAVDGRLSSSGRYLFALDERQELTIYDVLTGRRIPRMYSPSDLAVAWRSADDGTFLFALVHKIQDREYQDLLQLPSKGDYRVYRCNPRLEEPCELLHEVPEDVEDPPLFAE